MAVESDKVYMGKTVDLPGLLSSVILAPCERRGK